MYQSCVIMLCVTFLAVADIGDRMLRRQDMGQMKNTQYDIMIMEMDIFLVASHHYKADTGSGNTQNTP